MRRLLVLAAALAVGCSASTTHVRRVWVDTVVSRVTESRRGFVDGVCRGVMIAQIEGVEPVTIIAGGALARDRVLTVDYQVTVGNRYRNRFEFYDLEGLKPVGCRWGWVTCYEGGAVTGSSVCTDGAFDPLAKRRQGAPRLEVRAPPMVLPGTAGPYGAVVTFHAEVLGVVNEEWYCPEIRVRWSDETVTSRESDCEPWDGTQTHGSRWVFTRGLGIGTHQIVFELWKAGGHFATERVSVEVLGVGE